MIFRSKNSEKLTNQTELSFEQSPLVISPSVVLIINEQKLPFIYLRRTGEKH